MARSVPSMSDQSPGNPISSGLWNTQVSALGRWATRPVIFSYWQNTTAQSLPNNTATAIQWDTRGADSDTGFASGNPTRFTATVTGWYEISGTAVFAANNTGARTAQFAVNGAAVPYGLSQGAAVASVRTALSAQIIYHLAAGDFVELWATQTSGAALGTAQGSVLNLSWLSV
jgi:hypothetical protein